MSEAMEQAHEHIEHHASHSDAWARGVAVLVSFLAASLALAEIGAQQAQNAYLTDHVSLSNDWAFYQAKNQRAAIRDMEVEVLASLPNAQDPAIQTRIRAAQATAARLRDDPIGHEGMKQLAAKAGALEARRDVSEHRYHSFEYAGGALEIAIVLASVSVVTRMRALTFAAAAIGAAAALAALAIAVNLF